ncbi:hypothetical protein [Rhabdochlamydiaceae symbiont of Dictyostelium giganteum]|uniref:hypothetical protein n=1 Tax=Rhabdochlamydiaceae symbiont of Dictyostelium giganteum TaxID=3342349 RepID=UPI00384DD6DC
MSRTVESPAYTQALQTLEGKLQASLESLEMKKVINYLATLQSADLSNPFKAFPVDPQQNIHVKNFIEEIDQLAKNIFKMAGTLADGADLQGQKVCQDLHRISYSLSYRHYQIAFDRCKNHIANLRNPYLKRDILKKLQECELTSNTNENVRAFSSLLSLTLPEETRRYLQQFSEDISHFLFHPFAKEEDHILKVKKDITQIIEAEYQEKISTWDAYNLFFNLLQIKMLGNEAVEKIHALINSGNIDTFKREIEGILKENSIDKNELEKEIKKTNYHNIVSLLSQLIKQKPLQKEGLGTYWSKPAGFFCPKTLYLTDPESLETHSGTILTARKTPAGGWLFGLHDGSEVQIEEDYTTTITQKHRYKFWMALINHTIKKGDMITLEQASDRQMGEWLCPGDYTIANIQEFPSSLGKDPYVEVQLLDTASRELIYTLRSYYHVKDQMRYDHGILIYGTKDGRFSQLWKKSVPTAYFNATHTAIRSQVKHILGVKESNIDDQIIIKDERDENKIKLAHLEAIKKQQDVIRAEFLKPEGLQLLNLLLDHLVSHQMKTIGEKGMQDLASQRPDLNEFLNDMSKQYSKHLSIQCSPEKILKRVVKEANYALLVDKNQSVVVSKTMKLLKDAYKHLDKIKDQNVVFFLGNTGAGKSAAISYFLGAEMEVFINHVGDEVIRIKESQEEDEPLMDYPTIGQSLGESETLYAKGYPAKNRDYVLGDCPGFNDTRGGDFELCTNLSIDQAIDQSKSVRSIVITVPIHAFLVDRANALIELVETIREKFTDAFDPAKAKINSNFFLLITKKNQVGEEVVKNIRNGNRIKELWNESDKRLDSLMKESQAGGCVDEFELKSIQRRKDIWHALRLMHDKGQIDLLDVEDTFERDQLLHKYTTAPTAQVDKGRYVKAMQSQDMQMKMGKYIEMSTHTWTHLILKPYLNTLPGVIQKFHEELYMKEEKVTLLEEAKKERGIRIHQLIEMEKKLAHLIDQLETAKENGSSLEDSMLQEELESKLQLINDQNALQIEGQHAKVAQNLITKQEELEGIKKEINHVESLIAAKKYQVEVLQKEIVNLSHGSITKALWETSYVWGQTLNLVSYVSEAVKQRAFNEIRHSLPGEVTEYPVTNTTDYRGRMGEIALIEKEYRVVPKDASMQADFMKALAPVGSSLTASGGKFTAVVEGNKFSIDLGRRVSPDGKKMIYSFKTEWDGITLPWIKITHTIPNADFHEAAITNKESEIGALTREIEEKQKVLHGNKARGINLFMIGARGMIDKKDHLITQITILEKEEQTLSQEKARAKNVITSSIEEIQRAKQEELESKIQEREREESSKAIEIEMSHIQHEIEDIENNIRMKEKEKRNFAIIVKSQGETAKLLREFSNLISHKKILSENKESLVTACEEFKVLYDQNIHHLESEWKKDLNFSST